MKSILCVKQKYPSFIDYRKDWILNSICLCITLIGLPTIWIKKLKDRKKIRGIPKSNIKPMANHTAEESFEMKSFHNIPRLVVIKSVQGVENQSKTSKNKPLNSLHLNTSVKNKGLLSFSGVLILALDFILILYFTIGSNAHHSIIY